MTTTINPNWKKEVREFFASVDEVAYREFTGTTIPTFTQVKVEIMNRRTIREASDVSALVSKLYRD